MTIAADNQITREQFAKLEKHVVDNLPTREHFDRRFTELRTEMLARFDQVEGTLQEILSRLPPNDAS